MNDNNEYWFIFYLWFRVLGCLLIISHSCSLDDDDGGELCHKAVDALLDNADDKLFSDSVYKTCCQ